MSATQPHTHGVQIKTKQRYNLNQHITLNMSVVDLCDPSILSCPRGMMKRESLLSFKKNSTTNNKKKPSPKIMLLLNVSRYVNTRYN